MDGGEPETLNKRYYTIGEVSEMCDVKVHVLRYWENGKIPKLKPVRRQGRRYYRPEDVALVRQIRDMVEVEGYSLDGVRQKLSEREVKNEQPQTAESPCTRAVGKAISDLEVVAAMLRE